MGWCYLCQHISDNGGNAYVQLNSTWLEKKWNAGRWPQDDTEEIEVDYDELSDVQFSKVEENEIKETPPCSGDDCSHENQDDMTWTASRPFSRSSLTLVIIYLWSFSVFIWCLIIFHKNSWKNVKSQCGINENAIFIKNIIKVIVVLIKIQSLLKNVRSQCGIHENAILLCKVSENVCFVLHSRGIGESWWGSWLLSVRGKGLGKL